MFYLAISQKIVIEFNMKRIIQQILIHEMLEPINIWHFTVNNQFIIKKNYHYTILYF